MPVLNAKLTSPYPHYPLMKVHPSKSPSRQLQPLNWGARTYQKIEIPLKIAKSALVGSAVTVACVYAGYVLIGGAVGLSSAMEKIVRIGEETAEEMAMTQALMSRVAFFLEKHSDKLLEETFKGAQVGLMIASKVGVLGGIIGGASAANSTSRSKLLFSKIQVGAIGGVLGCLVGSLAGRIFNLEAAMNLEIGMSLETALGIGFISSSLGALVGALEPSPQEPKKGRSVNLSKPLDTKF